MSFFALSNTLRQLILQHLRHKCSDPAFSKRYQWPVVDLELKFKAICYAPFTILKT